MCIKRQALPHDQIAFLELDGDEEREDPFGAELHVSIINAEGDVYKRQPADCGGPFIHIATKASPPTERDRPSSSRTRNLTKSCESSTTTWGSDTEAGTRLRSTITVGTVSYTHLLALAVRLAENRQQLRLPWLVATRLRPTAEDMAQGDTIDGLLSHCLLYTSRCV